MFNFMHPQSVFRRKPVAEATVRHASRWATATSTAESTGWALTQDASGNWEALPLGREEAGAPPVPAVGDSTEAQRSG